MKKLNEVELMDILDEAKTANSLHEDDAISLEDAKLAMMALRAWEEAEPIQASADFWPKLREKLPTQPPRSAWSRATGVLGAWIWPSHSPLAASMRVAMLAAILALASFWFAPEKSISPTVATEYTSEEKVFIERSLKKHKNYVTTAPSEGGLEIPAGDGAGADIGEGEASAEYVP